IYVNQLVNFKVTLEYINVIVKNCFYKKTENNMENTYYMKNKLKENGFEVLEGISFNEFVVKFSQPIAEINEKLLQDGFIGGFDLGFVDDNLKNHMLIAVTELRTKDEIDTFIEKVGEYNA